MAAAVVRLAYLKVELDHVPRLEDGGDDGRGRRGKLSLRARGLAPLGHLLLLLQVVLEKRQGRVRAS